MRPCRIALRRCSAPSICRVSHGAADGRSGRPVFAGVPPFPVGTLSPDLGQGLPGCQRAYCVRCRTGATAAVPLFDRKLQHHRRTMDAARFCYACAGARTGISYPGARRRLGELEPRTGHARPPRHRARCRRAVLRAYPQACATRRSYRRSSERGV